MFCITSSGWLFNCNNSTMNFSSSKTSYSSPSETESCSRNELEQWSTLIVFQSIVLNQLSQNKPLNQNALQRYFFGGGLGEFCRKFSSKLIFWKMCVFRGLLSSQNPIVKHNARNFHRENTNLQNVDVLWLTFYCSHALIFQLKIGKCLLQ